MTSYTHEKEQYAIAVEGPPQGCFEVPRSRKGVIYCERKHNNVKGQLKVVRFESEEKKSSIQTPPTGPAKRTMNGMADFVR